MAASGTGNPKVKANTRERVISSDVNRQQSLAGQHVADTLRFLLDPRDEQDFDSFAGSVEQLGAGNEAPLRGTVLSGLRARPIDGTVDMLITAGSALLVDNASPGTDDSRAAVVTDPGIQTTGVLTLTPGAGSIRIDVLECQRVTLVTETDNRDIFNPATGLFAPAQVDKITVGRLVYRLRTGTAGAGFPGVAAGWMPLAVCRVAAGATSWDTVIIWDVRPLASDRWNAPFDSPRTVPERGRSLVFTDVITTPGEVRVSGLVEAQFGGYRAGGHLGVTLTTGATSYIDVAASINRASNFPGYTADRHWYLYAVFPYALPRWVRYTDSGSGGRVPRGTRGILAVTSTRPTFTGAPDGAVGSPSALGLADVGIYAMCLLAGRVTDAGTPVPQGIACDGRVTTLINAIANPIGGASLVAGVSAQWVMSDDTTHPAGARAIWVRLRANFTSTGPSAYFVEGTVTVSGPDAVATTAVQCEDMATLYYTPASNLVAGYSALVRVPLASDPFDPTNGGSSPRSFRLTWTHNCNISGLGDANESAQTIEVVGWEMGP